MGDFNAKVGSDNHNHDEVMGIHGLGKMNENGFTFANICADKNLAL